MIVIDRDFVCDRKAGYDKFMYDLSYSYDALEPISVTPQILDDGYGFVIETEDWESVRLDLPLEFLARYWNVLKLSTQGQFRAHHRVRGKMELAAHSNTLQLHSTIIRMTGEDHFILIWNTDRVDPGLVREFVCDLLAVSDSLREYYLKMVGYRRISEIVI